MSKVGISREENEWCKYTLAYFFGMFKWMMALAFEG